jgi:ParB-like chromosome segregation protein Spo0J
VGHGEEAPDQLLANPRNWRVHPKAQQDALAGALGEVGWVAGVIVNKRTGHVVDGHARVGLAISRNEPTVPVVYVDLDENEEAIVLASLDPLAAMAVTDAEKLAELLGEIHVGDAALREMFEKNNPPDAGGTDETDGLTQTCSVLVTCKSEAEQAALLEELSQRGMECRALMS